MKVKGILLDIDNTLYDYNKPHKLALNACMTSLSKLFDSDPAKMEKLYIEAKNQIHLQLPCTASSHNRLLYFQRMFEIAQYDGIDIPLVLYRQYWDVFIKNITLYEGVIGFLEEIKKYKVCFLTDLTADVQFEKINKLKLSGFADYIVTSEEAGVEKPHPEMFRIALKKMSLSCEDVCMIGDDYNKDIKGAANMNIRSFWLNKRHKKINLIKGDVIEFQDFNSILGYF